MAIIPYRVDVPMERWPIANWLAIGGCVVFSGVLLSGGNVEDMALSRHSAPGFLTHMWAHGDVLHLVGNMVFLWVFGNAVCAKIGNLAYVPLYVALGLVAAVAHVTFDPHPAVGASGAVNGVAGMFLVLYPANEVSCLCITWWTLARRAGAFQFRSFWMILLWLIFDILGAVLGGGGIAYYAHLGGFAAGVALAVGLVGSGLVKMRPHEKSLLEYLGLARGEERSST